MEDEFWMSYGGYYDYDDDDYTSSVSASYFKPKPKSATSLTPSTTYKTTTIGGAPTKTPLWKKYVKPVSKIKVEFQ